MHKLIKRKTLGLSTLVLGLMCIAPAAYSHHSFAIYEIETKSEIKGKLTSYKFKQPHITMHLEVTLDNGKKELWEIESMAPRRWKSNNLDEEFVKVGDEVSILGWAARNGGKSMALSTIIGEKGTMVVRDRIRQRSANQAIPKKRILTSNLVNS